MAWAGWHAATAPPMPGVIPAQALQSTVVPNPINAAPPIVTPTQAAVPGAAVPAGMQYTQEQWAQMQQQNWQQWAQWQQQYQQWHQQYGAEYQKSISAMTAAATPAVPAAAPPPLPSENKPPPPPPPDDGYKATQYSTAPPKPTIGYSTYPQAMQQYNAPPPNQYTNPPPTDWQNSSNKRPLSQTDSYDGSKRQMVQNNQGPKLNWQNQPPPAGQTHAQKVLNLEELTEAERKFDKEFAAWEAQFNKWKDQNANHPDKTQYLEYEKKWESWRNSLLDRREQMRKKRMALQASMALSAAKPPMQASQDIQKPSQNIQQPPLSQPSQPSYTSQKEEQTSQAYSQPPPTQNNEPLTFKASSEYPEKNVDIEPESGENNFLKSSSPTPGGIPGLDLVKEGENIEENDNDNAVEESTASNPPQPPASKGPDLDAISKGINSILGDPNLLNMLSKVSHNQNFSNFTSGPPINTQPHVNAPQSVQNTSTPISSLINMPLQRPGFDRAEVNPPLPPQQPGFDRAAVNPPLPPHRPGFDRAELNPPMPHQRPGFDRGDVNPPMPAQRPGFDRGEINPGRPSLLGMPNLRPSFERSEPSRDGYSEPYRSEAVNLFDDQTRMSFTNGPNDQDYGYGNNAFNSNRPAPASNNFSRFSGPNNQFGGLSNNDYNKFGRNNSFDGPPGPNMGLNQSNKFRYDGSSGPTLGTNNFRNEGLSGPNMGLNQPRNFRNEGPSGPNMRLSQPNNFRNGPGFNRGADYGGGRQGYGNFKQGNQFQNEENGDPWNEEDDYDKYHDMFNDEQSNEHPPDDMEGPPYDDEQPPYDDDCPPYDDDRPPYDNEGPPYDDERPPYGNERPPYGNERPPYGDKPPYDNRQPYGDECPPYGNDCPPYGNEHPPYVNDHPIDVPPTHVEPLVEDGPMFVPEKVIDYEHKPLKEPEPEVSLDVLRMFDYRHKPVNRIPYPQRPIWLSSTLRNIKQFDPLGSSRFERDIPPVGRFESEMPPVGRFERDIPPVGRFEREMPPVGRFERENIPPSNRYSPERLESYDRQPMRDDRIDIEYSRDRNVDSRDRIGNSRDRMADFRNDRERNRDYDRNSGYNRNRERSRDKDYSRDRDYGRGRDRLRYESPKRSKEGNSRFADKKPERSDRLSDKMDLEDLSDDDWADEKGKNSPQKEGLKFSPPPGAGSPDLTMGLNPVNPVSTAINQNLLLEDLIYPPGRHSRAPRIVIILRGPPGSGKTHLAKLIKDKEVENGGSAPRILSLDDYFMVEHEKEVEEDGKKVKIKEMTYEYEAEMEESYQQSLVKSFKKTITDGYFPFVVVDNVNQKVKTFGEMWSFAKNNGFQVYICQLDLDPEICSSRNIHNRSKSSIEDCIAGWEPTPSHHPLVDATSFFQSAGPIEEVEMEEEEQPQDQPDEPGERDLTASTNPSGPPGQWKNTSNWTTNGRNQQNQTNRGRREFGGLTWRNRNNRRR